jgi:ElaB/YqjD/DUF883 family membrane-anchored ribosome-binding protein
MGPGEVDLTEVDSVEREVDELRERTQALLAELEGRVDSTVDDARGTLGRVRHAVDLRAHLREHPVASAGVGAGALVLVGVGVYFGLQRRAAARRLPTRLRRRAAALRLLVGAPERFVRAPPPLGRRLLGAALIAVVTSALRAQTLRLLR